MVHAETKYKLFRRIFNKKLKTKPGIELPEPLETCSEDEVERAKVRKIQLALKAQRNHHIQYKKLEKIPVSRCEVIATHTVFGVLLTLTIGAFLDLMYALFVFETHPSDPLDVFRSVVCDNDGCTVRSYFDLEPPSIVGILIWLVFGIWSLFLCIRNLFGPDNRRMLIHVFSASLLGLTYIVKREQIYSLAREPL